MATFKGSTADFYVATGASIPFTNLSLTDAGDHTNYSLASNDIHRYWDEATALVIQTSPDGVTWTTVSSSLYTIQWVGGKVTFLTANGATIQVRAASGAYFTVAQCGNGTSWELTSSLTLNKATTFGNSWKLQQPGVRDASIKFSRLYLDTYFYTSIGTPFIAVLYVDTVTGHRYECYVRFKQDQLKVTEEGIDMQDVDLDVDSALYYVAA